MNTVTRFFTATATGLPEEMARTIRFSPPVPFIVEGDIQLVSAIVVAQKNPCTNILEFRDENYRAIGGFRFPANALAVLNEVELP